MDQIIRHLFLLGAAAALTLTACSPIRETRGNMVEDKNIMRVEPFITSKQDVRQMLGSPAATSIFDGDTWYYIGQKTEQTAFSKPEVTERKVVAVSFTEEGFVSAVQELDSEGYDITLSKRETPTAGHDLTLMQQLLGNIGRFSGESDNPATPTL